MPNPWCVKTFEVGALIRLEELVVRLLWRRLVKERHTSFPFYFLENRYPPNLSFSIILPYSQNKIGHNLSLILFYLYLSCLIFAFFLFYLYFTLLLCLSKHQITGGTSDDFFWPWRLVFFVNSSIRSCLRIFRSIRLKCRVLIFIKYN